MEGSMSNAFETNLLELLFNNTDLEHIGDSAGLQNSAAAGNLYVALYTEAPDDASAGTECNYGSYARVAVARSGAGWTVSGNNASNAAAITFPQAASGTNTAVAFGIHTLDGDLLFWGDLTAPLSISAGVTPEFAIGALDVNFD